MSDDIGDSLGVSPMDFGKRKPITINQREPDQDFEYTRENLMHVIERGRDALDELIGIAQQSQHPRAYEVISTLIKTLSDTNKDLLELRKKDKDLKDTKEVAQTINNNLYLTTSELQKLIDKSNAE